MRVSFRCCGMCVCCGMLASFPLTLKREILRYGVRNFAYIYVRKISVRIKNHGKNGTKINSRRTWDIRWQPRKYVISSIADAHTRKYCHGNTHQCCSVRRTHLRCLIKENGIYKMNVQPVTFLIAPVNAWICITSASITRVRLCP